MMTYPCVALLEAPSLVDGVLCLDLEIYVYLSEGAQSPFLTWEDLTRTVGSDVAARTAEARRLGELLKLPVYKLSFDGRSAIEVTEL